MGWESRGKAGPYYYRSVRRGKRVLREYLGRGVAAERAAREDEQLRAARAQEHQAIIAEMAQAEPIQLMADNLEEEITLLTEASMLTEGYRRTNYGPWRRKRGN